MHPSIKKTYHPFSPLFVSPLVLYFLFALWADAEIKLPKVIGSNMVLQRDLPVPIWGWGEAGEKVTVSFAGQSKSAIVDQQGNWIIRLEKLKANAYPSDLVVEGSNRIELENILVGEVWICSGQSNMEWKVSQCANPEKEITTANYPNIRLFDVPGHTVHRIPQRMGNGKWQVCSPESVASFSAAGYYFGRRLHRETRVPIGLIGSNWGGTRIEPWTTLAGFRSIPELSNIANAVEDYNADTPIKPFTPTAIYNSMVHPLTPLALRGAIWYQGESNAEDGAAYYRKKHALVNGWRQAFQNPKLAFYWVQLCNFRTPGVTPGGGDGWAKIREAQARALDLPDTGMAVIIELADVDNPDDIHPKNKQDVGARLAQWALHQTYGKKELVPSGPLFAEHQIKGEEIIVSFRHVGSGLMVGKKEGLSPTKEIKGGILKHFSIAGEDKQWHWADARIKGDRVVLSSLMVRKPVAARYAYTMNPADANLYNKEGLPAGPFRTDDW